MRAAGTMTAFAKRPLGAVMLAAAVCACEQDLPPRGQLVLHVDTDAIVPAAPGTRPEEARLAPMVDRASFELFVDGRPVAGGVRSFAVDEPTLREGRLSVGVLPPPGLASVTVRVRLFRADRLTAEQPPVGVTLDSTVVLPAVGEEGITDVHVVMRAEDFGAPLGPIPAAPGRPPSSRVGTFRGGRRAPCGGRAGPEEVCVPGGTFFFGNPAFRGRTMANDIVDERLVAVSPFFLDRTEVTVGAFRRAWPALEARGLPAPKAWSGVRTLGAPDEAAWCTFAPPGTQADGIPLDDLPLSCVPWATARAYCEELGKDLPSEAEFEYVTSGLGEEWAFPWGDDEPSCTDAIWGRGGVGPFAFFSDRCREPRDPGWVALPGSAVADRLEGGVLRNGSSDAVVDLAGNLGEWMVDLWAQPSEPPWSSLSPAVDPRVTTPSEAVGVARVVRGGDWATTALVTRAGLRLRSAPDRVSPRVGFRCRRSAGGP